VSASTELALRIRRGDFALEVEASWDERVAVVFGPSGSGKSTLFEAVLGLLPGPCGRIRLGGRWLDDPAAGVHVPAEQRALGWVPQDPTLFPHLTVDANLRYGARRAVREGQDPERALARAVGVLQIGPLLGRRVGALSGGERQRVAIARALASGPRALLLDEPLASLDLPLRARVLPYLLRVRDELGLPMLYVTHEPDEAMLVGDVVLVLDRGRVVATGPPHQVLWSRDVRPLSAALENVLDARVVARGASDSRIETSGGLNLVIPSALDVGERVRAGIPAHDLLLAAEAPGRISARNVFPATVVSVTQEDGAALVHLDAGPDARERLVAKLTPAAAEELALHPGTRAHVVIKAQAIRRLA
jgi:molybdate transport system ATP-binding protein